MTDRELLDEAIKEARLGLSEGGLPIGSVLGDERTGDIVARGHNLRVQTDDPDRPRRDRLHPQRRPTP